MARWVQMGMIALLSLISSFVAANPLADAHRDWQQAQRNVVELRNKLGQLAQHIQELKRTQPNDHPQLAAELRRSVLLQTQLEAADSQRRTLLASLDKALRERIQLIDNEMLNRVPRLKKGPLKTRQAEARVIMELRRERKQLHSTLKSLTSVLPSGRWAAHLQAAPLTTDPSELQARADFLEDARDQARVQASPNCRSMEKIPTSKRVGTS